MKNLYEAVLKIVNEQLGESLSLNNIDVNWQELTYVDNLDIIEVFMSIEQDFDVELDESESEKYNTVSKIVTRLIEDWPDEVEQYEINLPTITNNAPNVAVNPENINEVDLTTTTIQIEPSLKMFWDGKGKPIHKQKILYLPSDQIFTYLAESSSGKTYVCEEPDGKLTKVFPYECDGLTTNRAKEHLSKLIADKMKLIVDNYMSYRNDEIINDTTAGLAEQLNILYNHAKADILGETK